MRPSAYRTALALLGSAALACTPADPSAEAPAEGEPDAASGVIAVTPGDVPFTGETATYQGMMTYLADAPTFVDCTSGLVLPLAQEEGYPGLERSYLASRTGPGEPVLVTVRGRVLSRPGMDGGTRPTLVVAEVQEVAPHAGCGASAVDRPLENTEWRLDELAGAPVPPEVVATIRFVGEDGGFEGYAGCGPYSGRYELAGSGLTLVLTAGAGVACTAEGEGALRRDFLDSLRRTGGFRLLGPALELTGEAGPVARFVAPGGG